MNRSPMRFRRLGALLLLPAALIMGGCGSDSDCPECPEVAAAGPSTDPTVTLITIGADLTVSPSSPALSLSGGGAIQWHNAGTEAVRITLLGSPLSVELAAGAYSNVHRPTAEVAAGMSFSYDVTHGTDGPPDPPGFSFEP